MIIKLKIDFECPSPLIINPDRENPGETCVGYCCIPCPPPKYFYLEGQLDAAETVNSISFSSNTTFCLFQSIIYLWTFFFLNSTT